MIAATTRPSRLARKMSMSDLSKYFADPNGPAYRTSEHRSGPPLDYVAEKLRNALFELHAAVQASGRARAASLPEGC